MLDPRKEMSELFEMTDILRRQSLTIVQHYDAMPGNVRDSNASGELEKFLQQVKLMQEKVRDCMRALRRLQEEKDSKEQA